MKEHERTPSLPYVMILPDLGCAIAMMPDSHHNAPALLIKGLADEISGGSTA
jgi:hypothetical protein